MCRECTVEPTTEIGRSYPKWLTSNRAIGRLSQIIRVFMSPLEVELIRWTLLIIGGLFPTP